MAVGACPHLEGFGDPHQEALRHIPCAANPNPASFYFGPLSALLLTIDSQSCLQDMDDEVVYYVNRDSAGWVEQHVRCHVYIELKLECTRNRVRNEHRARDDWVCVYCRGSFPSKLRLTDHRCGGCPCGPVNSRGLRLQLPVYPNLNTAIQGKDLKLVLQRGDVWENLQVKEVWFTLNPELLDVTNPPPRSTRAVALVYGGDVGELGGPTCRFHPSTNAAAHTQQSGSPSHARICPARAPNLCRDSG